MDIVFANRNYQCIPYWLIQMTFRELIKKIPVPRIFRVLSCYHIRLTIDIWTSLMRCKSQQGYFSKIESMIYVFPIFSQTLLTISLSADTLFILPACINLIHTHLHYNLWSDSDFILCQSHPCLVRSITCESQTRTLRYKI